MESAVALKLSEDRDSLFLNGSEEEQIFGLALAHAGLSRGGNFPQIEYQRLVTSVLRGSHSVKLREFWRVRYLSEYADLRYFYWVAIRRWALGGESEWLQFAGDAESKGERIAEGLAGIAPKGGEKGYIKDVPEQKQRHACGSAWISVLAELPMGRAARLSVLDALPRDVLPYVSEPMRLANAVMVGYERGRDDAEVCVAALRSVFTLLLEGKLGDPEATSGLGGGLYLRLYELMGEDALKCEGFVELIATAAESGLVPQRYCDAFMKKCLQIACWCESSVSAELIGIAAALETRGGGRMCSGDAYRENTLEGGGELWELDLLRGHWNRAVSRASALVGARKSTRTRQFIGVDGAGVNAGAAVEAAARAPFLF